MTRTILAAAALILALATPAVADPDPLPHVETRGSGDTHLLLIHNLQADWPVWREFMDAHASTYTSHAIRLPGCGGSERLPRPANEPIGPTPWTDAVLDALADYLESSDTPPVYAVGHGSGASIATRLALEHPGLVKGVVAVDALPTYPVIHGSIPLTPDERATGIRNNFLKYVDDIALDEWRVKYPRMASQQAIAQEHKDLIHELAKQVGYEAWRRWSIEYFSHDLNEEVKEADFPYLSIGAINDGVLRFMRTRVMAEETWRVPFDDMPNASSTLMDETEHYVFLDRPEVFNQILQRFIKGEPQPPYSYVAPGNEDVTASDAE